MGAGERGPEGVEAERVDVDVVLRALSNERRRHVLDTLDDTEQAITVRELSARITESEYAPRGARNRDRVAISLYHKHLPLLSDAGLIEYDPARKTVRQAADIERIEPLLDASRRLT